MKIMFFEEFPTEENMNKLRLIKFQSMLFVAAYSYDQFRMLEKKYSQKNIEFAYWPILPRKQGYWLSPFVPSKILKRVLRDSSRADRVLIDLEFPRNKWLLLNVFDFSHNKRLLRKFLNAHRGVYTAEYPTSKWLKVLGLVSSVKGRYKVSKMVYTKSIPIDATKIVKQLHDAYGDRLVICLGCIAPGINGREPILSPQGLRHDLEMCKTLGINEVGIFRLGGLNKEYLKVIEKCLYSKN